jgi:cardiolipin synthase
MGKSSVGEAVSKPGLNPLTVPNLISFIRLACVPIFVWLLFGRHSRIQAGVLIGVLGATDWVDGYIARRFNQVSLLGKILDPVADRLLLGVGIISILVDHSAPAWFCWLVIVREGLISLAVIVLGALGARRIDVTWVGKCGAFALMFAFPAFLWGHASWASHSFWIVAAYICGIPGLVLSWWALIQYVPLGRAALRDGRKPEPSTSAAG